MFNERAFIQQLETANTPELIQLVMRPTAQEEKSLRLYLGDERYQRMHRLALQQKTVRSLSASRPKGNVVVLHGIMGSNLNMVSAAGDSDHVWVHLLRLAAGGLARLRLGPDGLAEAESGFAIHATGIMKRYYGELLLTLAENWTTRAFWYDWRKDLRLAAAELEARLRGWFAEGEPIHFVAHSMGGLVVRTLIKLYPHRWQANDKTRLIMLGTPNYGSFLIPQMLTGRADILNWLAMLDLRHNLQEITAIASSFAGAYQMLPSPLKCKEWAPLYQAETYAPNFRVSQPHLDKALEHHQLLHEVVDPKRMIYIAGTNQPTYVDLHLDRLLLASDISEIYGTGLEGDGRVPHKLGILETAAGEPIPAYYVEAPHADLSLHRPVLAALDGLLENGETELLKAEPSTSRAVDQSAESLMKEKQKRTEERLAIFIRPLQARSVQPVEAIYISAEERPLTRAFIYGDMEVPGETGLPGQVEVPFAPEEITIQLVQGDITQIDKLKSNGLAVDAIGVGHYVGGQPRGSVLALDEAISEALLAQQAPKGEKTKLISTDFLLTQYMERGTIQGELGQIFLLDDPRQSRRSTAPRRAIAVTGMGLPGRCGTPELTVLARELCWALGRLGKQHLATVLIGAGLDNLSVSDAISAWIRGVKYAITGASTEARQRTLQTLTFVEIDPRRVIEMDQAITAHKEQLWKKQRLIIHYTSLTPEQIEELRVKERRRLEERLAEERRRFEEEVKQLLPEERRPAPFPTRITVNLNRRNSYCFGAITQTASIPEREIPLDPRLITQANDELAAAWEPERQLELGRFMARLLLPADFRSQLASTAPLVLMLDAVTARIHWELLAQTDSDQAVETRSAGADELNLHFLGTSRGLTRQLRTTFAPPPEPPPPYRRLMRVLVVADPAEDAPLPGAEEEGIVVADLFEQFNTLHAQSENRIEVVRLFGPREATRTAVLRQLMLRSYDVLHFAGHCVFDEADPSASGWIFSHGERLSVNELNRIDRIPSFVFSNACESGITPDRSGERSAELAPSFAESFFARGVSNFVCTAWPVDDLAAREFALRLYEGLLGIERIDDPNQQQASLTYRYKAQAPNLMYAAMRDARKTIATPPYDFRTWGAYQHYGNPYFRFFDPIKMDTEAASQVTPEAGSGKKPNGRRRSNKSK